jgi:hypothetical protein
MRVDASVLAAIVPAVTTELVFKKLRRSTEGRDGFFDIQTFLAANDFDRRVARLYARDGGTIARGGK